MSERPTEHPIQGLIDTALDNIKGIVDANAVIGTPVTHSDGTIIIPVSKVSVGFASGGSDLPTKVPKDMFGGGAGGGITVTPLGFLVVTKDGQVRLLQISEADNTLDRIVNMVPDLVEKLGDLVTTLKNKKADKDAE